MGLLQKIFDKNAAVVEKIYDYSMNSSSKPLEIASGLSAVPFGLTCEAAALAAKVKKTPITNKTSLDGLFFK